MPLISIIVPVYNVEKYIEKCIDSILNQTFKDFELILVDDGSTDKSGQICDEYLKKDNRVRVIHKKNGGLSDARNSGIDIARGEYIGFIDSDDYIDNDMYEILYNNMIDYNAEISICEDYICFENYKVKKSNEEKLYILNTEDAIGMSHKISPGVCNKLFKREIFEELRFPVGMLNEDVFIFMKILSKANQIVFITIAKYYYMQRQSSITKGTFDKRKWHCVNAWKSNLEFVEKNYPNKIKSIEYKYIGSYLHLLDQIILMPNYSKIEDYIKVRSFILKNIFKILKNPYILWKRKIAILIYIVNSQIYKKIIVELRKSRGLAV